MAAAAVNVNVKMYRVGELGDCFLLRFSKGAKKTHVLIDCGSFRNQSSSKDRLRLVAEDIKKQLAGKPLNVVVGTHQHNDHLSGFVHAEDIFREIGAEQVWLSWLDNPADSDASEIQQRHRRLVGLVKELPAALGAGSRYGSDKGHSKALDNIEEILQFYGIGEGAMAAGANAPLIPALGMEFLKSLPEDGAPEYLYPGQVLDLPGLAPGDVKVYVLGPPKNYGDIKYTNPRSEETFDHRLAIAIEQTEQLLSAMAFGTGNKSINVDIEEQFPFNEREKIYLEEDSGGSFDRKKEEVQARVLQSEIYRLYADEKNSWRNIENVWMDQGEEMAIYLNDLTNNSSLVLAFELVKSKKVLLFVGDAQTGNWRSWSNIEWPRGVPAEKTDWLLSNTVLYKVGHHASHNATYKPALEKMKHPELVALIPVEKSDPNITKSVNPWRMPAENLYQALKKGTNFKILRMDEGIPEDCRGKNPAWEKKVTDTDLYVELKIGR